MSEWRGEERVPHVLGFADIQRYRRAFQLMRDGAFAEAEQLMAAVANDMLVGHVAAERLLHRRHRAAYRELAEWLGRHADLPSARAIHALAVKRRTAGAPAPRSPETPVVDGMTDLLDSAAFFDAADGKPTIEEAGRPRDGKGRMTATRLRVRQLLKQGDLDAAERTARAAEARGLAGDERLQVRADLVRFLFFAGRDERAVDLVPLAEEAPVTTRWFAGLAAWRLHRFEVAHRHFQAVAESAGSSGWLTAAGAFWAARAQRALGAPEAAQVLLRQAAEHPVTFYGQLARRTLGDLAAFGDGTEKSEVEVDALAGIPAVRRAIALLDVGERELAVQELVAVAKAAPTPVADAVVAFARVADLRRAVPRITAAIREAEGALFDDAMYPMPRWAPDGGFAVDKALVYAIIKQESNFRSGLVSPRGARGLMQIMPRTAAFISPAAAQGRDLDDPAVNLSIGQRYIQHLLAQDPVRGNLMLMAAAYNGGLGRAARWFGEVDHGGDPLLFMEAVPAAETRQFIERVLAAMWIYQLRLGLPTPTLDAVAAGQWPVYASTEDLQRPSVASAENR